MNRVLDVPGARLHYEVRGEGPLVVLFGTPMDARSFEGLADLIAGSHTVVTTDPRGIRRSTVADADAPISIATRADDLARLIAHVDAGPAAVLGSSGGAVTALGLAQHHPDAVRLVIAHEPPLNELLPEREELREKSADIAATHLSGDVLGGWRKFLALADIELPEEFVQMMAAPGTEQDTADGNFQYTHLFTPSVSWEPDLAVLKGLTGKLVIGIGEDSAGELCDRTSRALAAALGVEPVMFPGGHIGFAEDPAAFAPRLREVLGR
ncbi:hydrolase [Actinorhabdospora filicis]|uniref:Hydrolase n=1 Tax=Actinorhabdospora filicis TaxID=1785913 RepID=A0A9W6STC1_9ACTN|nr:alpha/beta hydrolase [Actinorhabdospora filicis]GLZ81594.1 hydrolase [Actinorhabdospora filicis]